MNDEPTGCLAPVLCLAAYGALVVILDNASAIEAWIREALR